jgi:hypothetical protein
MTLSVFLAPSACSSQDPSALPSHSVEIERVADALKWLPVDTQTVIVANGPFRLQIQEPTDDQDLDAFYKQEKVSFADLIRSSVFYLFGCCQGQGDASESLIALADLEFEFALEGSRRFRAPRNFGMMSYQGSLIASVVESGKGKLGLLFDTITKQADELVEIVDAKVAVFHARPGDLLFDGAPVIYVTSPRPGLLCVASDRDYLETLLRRMAVPSPVVAFPDDLQEWKHVDSKASVFAIRHYRSDDAADDPTSPLRGRAAANCPDAKAVGLVFECREGETQTAIARYLTRAPDPIAVVRIGWMMPNEGLSPDFAIVAPGVAQISQVVVKPLPASRFWFVLSAYLGHAIYL